MIYVLAGNVRAADDHMRDQFPDLREGRDWILCTGISLRGRQRHEDDRIMRCYTWDRSSVRWETRRDIYTDLVLMGFSLDDMETFNKCYPGC